MTAARRKARGFSLVEMLIGLCVMSLAGTALTSLMIHNSRINRAQQMAGDVQNNARNSMELIVSRLRSAGWDPLNKDIPVVVTDPDLSDPVSQIEIFADHDEDGFTTSDGEQVLIRHSGDRIEWRVNGDPSSPFSLVASDISNDADGDGTPEPMFVPDDPSKPTTVLVRVTARSPVPDPATGRYITYTLTNEVALRKTL